MCDAQRAMYEDADGSRAEETASMGDGENVEEALRLAKDVLAERAANETSAREAARRSTGRDGRLSCALTTSGKAAVDGAVDDKRVKKIAEAVKDYYEFSAPLRRVKPHQTLAIFRAESAKVLRVRVDFDASRASAAAMKSMVGSRRLRRGEVSSGERGGGGWGEASAGAVHGARGEESIED